MPIMKRSVVRGIILKDMIKKTEIQNNFLGKEENMQKKKTKY